MSTIILIITLLSIASARRGYCTEYKCNSIESNSDLLPCTEQYTDDKIFVQSCPTGFHCDIIEDIWSAPQQFESWRYFCKQDAKIEQFGNLAPGDSCLYDEQCFGHGTCSEWGTCEPENQEVGADCRGIGSEFQMSDKICDVGMYCNTKIGKCVRSSVQGESCDDFHSCKFGQGCFEDPESNKKSCVKLLSFANGDRTMDPENNPKQFCASGHHMTTDGIT